MELQLEILHVHVVTMCRNSDCAQLENFLTLHHWNTSNAHEKSGELIWYILQQGHPHNKLQALINDYKTTCMLPLNVALVYGSLMCAVLSGLLCICLSTTTSLVSLNWRFYLAVCWSLKLRMWLCTCMTSLVANSRLHITMGACSNQLI